VFWQRFFLRFPSIQIFRDENFPNGCATYLESVTYWSPAPPLFFFSSKSQKWGGSMFLWILNLTKKIVFLSWKCLQSLSVPLAAAFGGLFLCSFELPPHPPLKKQQWVFPAVAEDESARLGDQAGPTGSEM